MAIKSLKPRIQDLERFLKTLPPDSKSPTRAEKPVQKQRGETQAQIRDLNEELRLREELARAEQKPGNYLEVADTARKLNSHLQKTQRYQGSFQVTTSACFTCQGSFNHMPKGFGRYYKDVQGKKKRRKERLELITNARSYATQMPEGGERHATLKAADDFSRYIDAAEKAALSRDAYHFTDPKIRDEGAPVGYLRGSENPDLLRAYGISRDMLAPQDSKFRAELYIPDPTVFGGDAKPVLVFKGTDLTCASDLATDLSQATGNQVDYYERAIQLAMRVNQKTHGNFELAGHSLGGGMASACGIVIGCLTTALNPAGVHSKTVSKYSRNTTTNASNISAYVVEGEILNASQDGANHVGTKMLNFTSRSHLPPYAPILLVPNLLGATLSSVPVQVGKHITLSPPGGSSPSAVTRHSMDTVIASIEQEKAKLQRTLVGHHPPGGRV